jgi:hypothetical protein
LYVFVSCLYPVLAASVCPDPKELRGLDWSNSRTIMPLHARDVARWN